jgi:ATP-binding cassette, subfamily B (MDR/TAP), member 1
MIVSGTVLPLMDVVFGMFINVFNDFVRGDLSAAGYRSEVNRFR